MCGHSAFGKVRLEQCFPRKLLPLRQHLSLLGRCCFKTAPVQKATVPHKRQQIPYWSHDVGAMWKSEAWQAPWLLRERLQVAVRCVECKPGHAP